MAIKILINAIFCLTLCSFVFVKAKPTKGWIEVSNRWPSDPFEYFVATEHGHHFIDIKLPEQIVSGLNVRLEYYYNYGKIRPDVRFVPCNTSIEVVRDNDEQPAGQWLAHEFTVGREACQANPILVYNVLLHEAGDVFAWRLVSVNKEGIEATTTKPLTSTNYLSSLCRPSLCDEKLFKHPRFKSLIDGSPDSVMHRINLGVKVYMNVDKKEPFQLAFNDDEQKEPESIDQTKLNTCFSLELYMSAGAKLEVAIASSNDSINVTEPLEVIEPHGDADRWFLLKRCVTDYLPRLPAVYNNTAMFQFSPKGPGQSYIIMALKPLGPKRKSTWYAPIAHDFDGVQNRWFFTTLGGSRNYQEMLVELLWFRLETNEYKYQVSGMDARAESLDMVSSWMKWKDGDENTWLHFNVESADWIASVEFGWQDENGQWLMKKNYQPHELLETSVSADSGISTSSLVIVYRLEGTVGREFRLRLKLKVKHDGEGTSKNEEGPLKLLIKRIAVVKNILQ